jgi:hypothetical protein
MADDYEKLLAEVESTLGAKKPSGGSTPARRPAAPDKRAAEPAARATGGLPANVRTAVIAGAVAAGVVFALFAFLPFLGSVSGAAGAFLGVTIAVFVTGYLRR